MSTLISKDPEFRKDFEFRTKLPDGATIIKVAATTLMNERAVFFLLQTLLSLLLGFSAIGQAATLTVPAGYATIQAAINASINGDIVQVANGTYSENINFNGKLVTVISQNGAAVTKIQGATAATNSPVVTFSSGETSSAVLDGFTIHNQAAANDSTRGIYISGASPIIKNSIIEGNSTTFTADGAGVYINNSVPTFDACTIRANSAANNRNGGGMFITGAAGGATITNSTIGGSGQGNTATNFGGGIYFTGSSTGTLSISNSSIDYNSANAGAGIYQTGVSTTTTLTNTSVSNNTATYTPGGGGIYSDTSKLSLTNSNINNNTALVSNSNVHGGGIWLNGASSSATISGGTINGNHCGGNGGGIYITGSTAATPLSISGATISGNTAENLGGGIYLTSVTNAVNISAATTISSNTANWTGGGGIYNNAVTLAISDSHIDSNLAPAANWTFGGGGLYLTGAKTTTITNTTVNSNTTYGQGSGIYVTGGATLSFTGGSINSNASSASYGGGISVGSTSILSISQASIRGNSAADSGGGIYYTSTSATAASVTNCTITGNLTKGGAGTGGGIFTSNKFNLINSTVAGNYAVTTSGGGGIYKSAAVAVAIKNSILWGNTANGAADQINGVAPTVTYSDIQGTFAGTGNIATDPLFTSFVAGDMATSTTPKTSGDYHIQATSPAKDVGTATGAPATDIDGDSRPQGAGYDMGSDEYISAAATTTLATGADPGNTSLAPGGAAAMADAFTVQTSSGTDTLTAATVTLAAGTSGGLSLVEITNDAGATVYGSVANPASDTPAITLTTNITATTTATQHKIRITPKSHANMPAPPGSSYAVTAYISNWTGANTHAGSDTGGTTVTIDNLSPGNVTAATATAGNTQVSLAWANPADADLNSIVVLRRTMMAVSDVPVEGTTYVVGNTIGSSTVACVAASPTAACVDTGLTNGTAYYYKIFTKDANGNYSATGVAPAGSPATPAAATPSLSFLKTVAVTSDPVNGASNPKYIPGAEALYTLRVTNSGTGTVDNNTLIITDPIPANTELFTGNLSGGAPFIFTNGTPTSGLNCAFIALNSLTDCMDFSNDSGTSWTYVPNGSFDPAVTNIRFILSGVMNGAGGGNPDFDLSFRVRVK